MARQKRRRHRGRRKKGNWFTRLSAGKKAAVCLCGVLLCLVATGALYVAAKLQKIDNDEDIPVEDILAFEKGLFAFVDEKYPEVPASIRDEKEITEDTEKKLIQAIEEFKKEFVSEQ